MDLALHPVETSTYYADVILPLATARAYTYYVPEELMREVQVGIRVEVQFGKNKLYTGIIQRLHGNRPAHKSKPILGAVDLAPIVTPAQLELWTWMADYYGCTVGEVMHAALPANLKLASETRIVLSPLFRDDFRELNDQEYLIAEALTIQEELALDDVRGILQKKTILPIIRRLLDKKVIYLKEDLRERYQPKSVSCVRLSPAYVGNTGAAFALTTRSDQQTAVLMEYLQVSRQQEYIVRADLTRRTQASPSVIQALVKKGVFELYDREVSRLATYAEETVDAGALASQQERALQEIEQHFTADKPVLLHGVTGSGKTRIYLELMQAVRDRGGQVLYMLPEIALTTQIINRLQQVLGDDVVVYHSRLNNNERVELWQQIAAGKAAVVGPRSSLFLPFQQLELIIVDEEHDPSYKQSEPNPRYNGRDAAVWLAHRFGANILLGTATPSLESYQNVRRGKYGLVELRERYGGLQLPEIIVADARAEMRQHKTQAYFTHTLIEELKGALERGEQAILFQNRRGYAPTYRCTTCDWHSECVHCDVSLTYHKHHNSLKCHYCGYAMRPPDVCPGCGGRQLHLQGYGTEKIEDELKIYLPQARIGRMDLDTVRGKNAHAKLIHEFEEGELDILVGTQMVTKGLDFERVAVVGIISADSLLQFPDFRAGERAFQLMLQVAGRAGRKHRRGRVVIQAFNTTHPVLREVIDNNFSGFVEREIQERLDFRYPPFVRMVSITLKHKTPAVLNEAAKLFAHWLRQELGDWVQGPAAPYVGRIRNYYLLNINIKIDKHPQKISHAKQVIRTATEQLHATEGFSGVRVSVDVDPY